jgi:SPRY domain
VYVGAYAVDDDPSMFKLVIAGIVDRKSFYKQCLQLDAATRDYLTTRLDYYQVNLNISRLCRSDSSLELTVNDDYTSIAVKKITETDNKYTGCIWDASIHRYTATVNESKNMIITMGFAPSKFFDVSKQNHKSCGWYIFLRDGTLWSQNGDRSRAYSSKCIAGDTITCIYNASTSEISFEKNGVSLGVAYTNVKGEDIAPAVELRNEGNGLTLSIN